MANLAMKRIKSEVDIRSDAFPHRQKGVDKMIVCSTGVADLARDFGFTRGTKHVTDEIESASSVFYRGFIRGFFDADGSVQGHQSKGVSIRLSQISMENLQRVQRMLLRLGIVSKIYANRTPMMMRLMPDGRGDKKEYLCQPIHELVISGSAMVKYAELIGFDEPAKVLRLQSLMAGYKRNLNATKTYSVVTEIVSAGQQEVFDVNVDDVHEFDANGLRAHNCEIILRDQEFCNLSEVVVRDDDDLDDLLEKVETATWLGIIQATFTRFPYLSPKWKENCDSERLLGVSLTGQQDHPEILSEESFRALKSRALKVAKKAAVIMGIPVPAAITCSKPSGTVSQIVDSASGLHPRFAPYYIRRYRISAVDPLYRMIRAQGFPVSPENGERQKDWDAALKIYAKTEDLAKAKDKCSIFDPDKVWADDLVNTWVVAFPIKSPDGAVTTHDMTAVDQLEWYKRVQTQWCEHNASCTVYVRDHEWFQVGNWVYDNWDLIGGLSFLPHDGGNYEQMPYEAIDAEKYEELIAKQVAIDYSQLHLFELEDMTTGSKAAACSGTSCEL